VTQIAREARLAAQRFAISPTFAIAFNQELRRLLDELESARDPGTEDIVANLRIHLGLSVGKPGAPPPTGPRRKKKRTATRTKARRKGKMT
jgi:hypothetical protein